MAYAGPKLTARDIRARTCPACSAAPGQPCDRPKAASHIERMWLAQNHDPSEFEELRRKRAEGQERARQQQPPHDPLKAFLSTERSP